MSTNKTKGDIFLMDVMEKLLQWKAEYLDNLGRYGKVVPKEDWANIKNSNIEFYRELLGQDSIGYCYYYSRELALFLKDVKIIYCCIELDNGEKTGHAMILRDDCVYNTSSKQHYYLEAYEKMRGFEVYRIFSEEEYRREEFFDNIREGFIKWCEERNVYCDPQ